MKSGEGSGENSTKNKEAKGHKSIIIHPILSSFSLLSSSHC